MSARKTKTKDTKTETALAIRQEHPAALVPTTVHEAGQLAERLSRSSLIPNPLRGKPEDVLVVLMKGQELGLAPMQALSSIHVISGKAVCEAALMVGLCQRRRDVCAYFTLVESTDQKATYETLREGSPKPVNLTYTLAEAKAAGLSGKDNWKHHPAAMLRARASGALARAVYPDLVMGIYTPDEADEFRERPEPRVVTMPRRTSEPAPAAETKPEPSGEEDVQTEDDGFELTSPPDVPIWQGKVADVESKSGKTKGKDWTLFTIIGDDGERFGTFSDTAAEVAREAYKAGQEVAIEWEQTPRGQKLIEIRPVA